jgi:hypothetical protein
MFILKQQHNYIQNNLEKMIKEMNLFLINYFLGYIIIREVTKEDRRFRVKVALAILQ